MQLKIFEAHQIEASKLSRHIKDIYNESNFFTAKVVATNNRYLREIIYLVSYSRATI